jgi:D-alanyl-D-alanine carboxypeptidase
MNKYAEELGLKDTHFTNVYGVDDPKHYSNAEDLARLTIYALQNEIFRDIVGTAQITVADVSGKFSHKLQNTNKLVGKYSNVVGVKTGTTAEAGASLVAAAKGESGQLVVTVLLNSPERFNEGKALLDWALKAYTWIEPL